MSRHYKNEISDRKYSKSVEEDGFLSFDRKFWHGCGKKLINIKNRNRYWKNTSKRVAQEIEEATRDSIGNKIADKITQ